MKYKVLDSFKAQTDKGEMELRAGQVITLPHDKAIRLLNEGKITPVGKVAYKVWSEAIYPHHEIAELKGLSKESLKAICKVKETFQDSKVEQIKPKGSRT